MAVLNNSWLKISSTEISYSVVETWVRLIGQSIEGNYSTVEIEVDYYTTGWTQSGNTQFTTNTGGDSGVLPTVWPKSSTKALSHTFNVYHNNEGVGSYSGWTNLDGYYAAINRTDGWSFDLPTIPRQSTPTLSKLVANIGETITIYTNRKVNSYTHDLHFLWYDRTIPIGTGIATDTTFNLDETLLAKIPDSAVSYGTVRCITKSGNTVIGQRDVRLDVKVPDTFKPQISNQSVIELIDKIKAKNPDYTLLGLSKKQLTINAAAKGYATIKEVRVKNGNVIIAELSKTTGNTYSATTSNLKSGEYLFEVIDSRGLSNSITVTQNAYAYFKPTLTKQSFTRDTQTGDSGKVSLAGRRYTGLNNSLFITCTFDKTITRGSETFSNPTDIEDYTYDLRVTAGLKYDDSFNLTIVIEDDYTSQTFKTSLSKSIPTLQSGKNTVRVNDYLIVNESLKANGVAYAKKIIADTDGIISSGSIQAKGGLAIGGDDTFIVKDFSVELAPLAGQQARYVNVPYTIPKGYKLLCFFEAHTVTWCLTTIKGVTADVVQMHIYNWSAPSDITPTSKVIVSGLFIKTA